FLIALALLVGLMAWYRFMPSWHIVFFPVFVAAGIAATVGPSLWITALNVKYRDFRIIVPFIVQLGLYISPVGFSSSIVPEKWRLIYSLNPVVGVIDGFRWTLLGSDSQIYLPGMAVSFAVILLFMWFGVRQFRATEKSFADLI
ncbi:MAG: ABC transporter permease, partial [Rhizomicrobium sp.]